MAIKIPLMMISKIKVKVKGKGHLLNLELKQNVGKMFLLFAPSLIMP